MDLAAVCDAYEALPGRLDGGLLLLCDHASNAVPARYGDLGVAAADFERHIAYDIGAAVVTRHVASLLAAPAILTTYSRLLIDPNRGAADPTLVMRLSDGAIVPGNARIDAAEIAERTRLYWQPYRDRIDATTDAMMATGTVPAILSVHSFTPRMKGVDRPWHIGLLWDADARLAAPLHAALATEPDLQPPEDRIGDNEPYDGALPGDTMETHATRRGLPHVLIELRQDLIATPAQGTAWGERLARLLRPILAHPSLGAVDRRPSRAGRPPTRLPPPAF